MQPLTKRLVTEATVPSHVQTAITSPGPTKTALDTTYLPGTTAGATDGQVATWDAALGKFKPGTPSGGGAAGAYILAEDAGDTQAIATRRIEFTDAADAKGSVVDIWHWGNGTNATSQASYGLDIHNGIGARQALVTHQYSNAGPAWQLDNTDSNDGILVRNALNAQKNPTGTGNGKPFVFNDHGTVRFQIFNKGEVYINPGPDAVGSGIEIVGSTTAAKPLATMRHNGPAHGVVITTAATAAGFYPLNITGQNYGANMSTATDGGAVLNLTKNGTGAGTGVTIINKGTGVTIAYRDASALLSGITAAGEFEHYVASKGIILKAPGGVRYRITVADGGTIAVAAA